MYSNILVPTDGSELSDKAVAHAGRLAQAVGAKVTLFYAAHRYQSGPLYEGMGTIAPEDHARYEKELIADGKKVLETAAKNTNLFKIEVDQHVVINDFPSEAIIDDAAASGCDLIVMASHGRRGISAVLLGSETQKVLTHSKVPVLVVR